jgi:hypothetical protein
MKEKNCSELTSLAILDKQEESREIEKREVMTRSHLWS